MAVSHTTALNLLGKHVSFTVSLNVPEKYKDVFSNFCEKTGIVESVLIHLSGDHQFEVDGNLYSFDEVKNLSF